MAAIVKTRPYNSPTRRSQLAATKAAVLKAAGELMAKQGYSATTIEQIADAAGVAVPTVYKHFGTKANVVAAFVEQARQDSRIARQRQRLLAATDAREQIELIAQRTRLYVELGLYFAQALSVIGPDRELTKALRRVGADVRRSHLEYARSIEQKGALRAGLTAERAADYIWLAGNPNLLLTLRQGRGWSFDRCEQWLADVLTRLLLD